MKRVVGFVLALVALVGNFTPRASAVYSDDLKLDDQFVQIQYA